MRNRLSALLLLLLLLLPGLCLAERGTLSCEASAELPDADGMSLVTLRICNDGADAEAPAILNGDGSIAAQLDALATGESREERVRVPVNDSALERGRVSLSLSWQTDEGIHSIGLDIPLGSATRPALRLTRAVSDRFTDRNGLITITYRIENTGNTTLTELLLTDPAGDFEARSDELAPGDMLRFTQRLRPEEGVVSEPVIRCLCSGETLEETLAPLALSTGETALSLSMTATPADDSTLSVHLTIQNTGSTALTELAVYDDVRGILLEDRLRLPAGEAPLQLDTQCRIDGLSELRLRVEGRDEAGTPITQRTDTITLPADEEVGTVALSISAEANKTHISRAGYVTVTIRVTDTGTETARNVQLAEETLGTFYTLAAVPTGAPTEHRLCTEIREDTTLALRMEYTDTDGHLHTVYADPIEITVGTGGELPDEAPETADPALHMVPAATTNPQLYTLLIVGGLLLVAVLLIVLIAPAQRRRGNRKKQQEG